MNQNSDIYDNQRISTRENSYSRENSYTKWVSRENYLFSLAQEFNLSVSVVQDIASALGEEEDFDGLIKILKHYFDYKRINSEP